MRLRTVLPLVLVLATTVRAQTQTQVETYRHDAAGRLTRVTYDGKTTISLAYDANGNVASESVTPTPPPDPKSGGGGGSSGLCFIATAAYGSPLDSHVQTLRNFRDEHLKTNAPGRAFVAFYERVSPPIAAVIARHDTLRAVVRWILAPLVYAVAYPRTALAVALMLAAALVTLRRRRRAIRRRLAAVSGEPAALRSAS